MATPTITDTLKDLLEEIADGIGEMYAAARSDWSACDPNDVGLHGVHIKTWRAAYLEGCKDMAGKVLGRLPETNKPAFKEMVEAAFSKHEALLNQEAIKEKTDAGR